jgi:hypothetical protein
MKTFTKEEFKQLWDSNEQGGGITYEDIVECAGSWGLFLRPKTASLYEVKKRVLEAAGCSVRGMKTIDELDRLEKAATGAPWSNYHSSIEANRQIIVRVDIDEAKSPEDGDLIVALRNQARALIEVARAAEAFVTPWPEPGSKRHEALLEALAKLER